MIVRPIQAYGRYKIRFEMKLRLLLITRRDREVT